MASLSESLVPSQADELSENGEMPRFSDEDRIRLYREKKPLDSPNSGTSEYEQLQKFSKEVDIILLTINDKEFHAAIINIEKPAENFDRAVFFPKGYMVVGMFANKKTAIIHSAMGKRSNSFIDEAIKTFPEAHFVIGVGVCYAFDAGKHKFGDVLVSDKICDITNAKFKKNGKIENRGQAVDVIPDLYGLFCQDCDNEYKVSDSRESKVFSGDIVSYTSLMDNKVMRDKFHKIQPTAIGGEMEGGELLEFERKRKIKGVIVIKGVVDYADGNKSKEWQFTAAMAALHYTKTKLLRVATLKDKLSVDSPSKTGAACSVSTRVAPKTAQKRKRVTVEHVVCYCGEEAVIQKVPDTIKGSKQGTMYYKCPKPHDEQCEFSSWADKVSPSQKRIKVVRRPPTCGVCGEEGHTKRSKSCPRYGE